MHVQSNGGWLGGWLAGGRWPAGRPKPPPSPPPWLALFRGYDTLATLRAVIEHIKLNEGLGHLQAHKIVHWGGQVLRVCAFVQGDHMLQYKVCGRDGPASNNDNRQPCPCCDASAPEVLDYSTKPLPFAKSPHS